MHLCRAVNQTLQRLLFTTNQRILVNLPTGRGRCVVAKEDMRAGSLLFVSEPVGSVLTGQLGQQLQPQHLETHLTSGSQKLTAADR
jgi:hypothetical protein